MNKFEITREQYERERENPTPGFTVDMECRYWLINEPAATFSGSGEAITGPYLGTVYRSPNALLSMVNEAKGAALPGKLGEAFVLVSAMLDAGYVCSQDAAKELDTAMGKYGMGSKYITELIEHRIISFTNP